MRVVELAKVAAAAEALHLRRVVQRQGMRAAYGAGAAVFVIAVFVLLHVLAFFAMVPHVTPLIASAILLGVDLVVAGVLGYMAYSDAPDAIGEEAKTIRQQAIVEMQKSMTVMAMAGELTGMVLRRPSSTTTTVGPRSNTRLAGEIAARLLARR